MECMPVAINLNAPDLAQAVGRYVESMLGWQVVEDSDHLPAKLILCDSPTPGRRCVVIGDDRLNREQAMRDGALDALVWPRDASRLGNVTFKPKRIQAKRRLVISQSAPHVGASTLSLAIGSVYAWAGMRVALAATPETIVAAGMQYPGRLLACPNLWLIDPEAGPPNGFGIVIVEAPLSEHTQIIVGRCDRALVSAARTYPMARRVIGIGDGELLPREVGAFVGMGRFGHVGWSYRIARAGLRGALPQAFPGRFLKVLSRTLGQPVPGVWTPRRGNTRHQSTPSQSRHSSVARPHPQEPTRLLKGVS
ncbi:hypothetical protein [Stomatohabitans albus]|uniref:hypothetical protein n=1 Tax=Stomatohabitans albus TaxID=3110766 RepID=UPI00300D8FD7